MTARSPISFSSHWERVCRGAHIAGLRKRLDLWNCSVQSLGAAETGNVHQQALGGENATAFSYSTRSVLTDLCRRGMTNTLSGSEVPVSRAAGALWTQSMPTSCLHLHVCVGGKGTWATLVTGSRLSSKPSSQQTVSGHAVIILPLAETQGPALWEIEETQTPEKK